MRSSSAPLVALEHHSIQLLHSYRRQGLPGTSPRCLLRTPVAEALIAVTRVLPHGFGLAVFDGWRSRELQRFLYTQTYASTSTIERGFVAPPSHDPSRPSPHATGGAVDLTLTYEGRVLALGTHFDEFCSRSGADYFEGIPGMVRTLRRMLYWAMRSEGFVVLYSEWWHYELGTPRWGALTNLPPYYGGCAPATLGEAGVVRRDLVALSGAQRG